MSPRMKALRTFSSRGVRYHEGDIFKVKPRDAAALNAAMLAEPVWDDDEEAEESQTKESEAGRAPRAATTTPRPEPRAQAHAPSKNLDAMTVAELKAFASKSGIALKSGLTKSEILSVVRRSLYHK